MTCAISDPFTAVATTPPVFVPGEPWGYSVANDGFGISQGGTFIDGGRGKDPIYVNSSSSLRSALTSSTGGPILFEVGGTFTWPSQVVVDNNNKTVWGNTAPGGLNINASGSLSRGMFKLRGSNLIFKHLALRGPDKTGVDIFYCLAETNDPSPDHCLIENCSFAFGSDESFGAKALSDYSDNRLANITFYRCFSCYPLVAATGISKHAFNGIWQGLEQTAAIQCVMAHAIGRPLIRPTGNMSFINNLFFMWNSGQIITINDGQGVTTGEHANAKFRLEGNKFIGNAAGVTAYNGNASSVGAPTKIGQTYGSVGAMKIYTGSDNSMGGFNWDGPIPSHIVGNTSGFSTPDGYADNLLTGSDLDDTWLDSVGANPTTPDSVDTAAKNGIKNPGANVTFIDNPSDIGGYDSLPSTTHNSGDYLNTTLQAHIESRSWWLDNTQHDPCTNLGYSNRTKLEAYLDTFVAGVPGVDPN